MCVSIYKEKGVLVIGVSLSQIPSAIENWRSEAGVTNTRFYREQHYILRPVYIKLMCGTEVFEFLVCLPSDRLFVCDTTVEDLTTMFLMRLLGYGPLCLISEL